MAGVDIKVYVESPDTELLTYTTIRAYSDTSPSGSFGTLGGSTALVAGQRDYTVNNPAGDANTYHRITYYNPTGPVESAMGPVIMPGALTLLRLRVEAAQEAGLGFAATCSALGTTTSLIDARLGDAGIDAKFGEGGYIYRPSATAGDRLRRVGVSGFTSATGTWAPGRAWSVAPASGEVYHFFTECAPVDWPGEDFSWDRAIRNGLRDLWYRDFVNLGAGTATGQSRWSLAEHAPYLQESMIVNVWSRTTDSHGNVADIGYDTGGRYWRVLTESGTPTLEVYPLPGTDESLVVECNRTYEEMYIDADVCSGPQPLAVKATLVALYEALNLQRKGKYAGELAAARYGFAREYAKWRPANVVRLG